MGIRCFFSIDLPYGLLQEEDKKNKVSIYHNSKGQTEQTVKSVQNANKNPFAFTVIKKETFNKCYVCPAVTENTSEDGGGNVERDKGEQTGGA